MAILIKTSEQIEGIRKSCKLAASILRWIEPQIQEGITTEDINEKIHNYILQQGAAPAPLNYQGFPKSVCTSINEVVCHGIPDATKLVNGDIINVDVTPILDGYYGDTSSMFAVGEISEAARSLIDVTKRSLEIGIEQVKPGNRFGLIGYEIGKYATDKGYSVVTNFCGHGTGIHFHEEPAIIHMCEADSGEVMLPGMIFTIEPMINEGMAEAFIDRKDKWTARTIDGKLSAQFEHTVLVTDDGCEILTV